MNTSTNYRRSRRLKADRIVTVVFLVSLLFLLTFCHKDTISPVAVAEAFPGYGDSTMLIELNGEKSFDNSTYLLGLQFSWDVDSDGIWEIVDSRDPISIYQFNNPGIYNVTLKVCDHQGLCSTDSLKITIKARNTRIGQLWDDRDGHIYQTVMINNRWWMAENLNYGHLLNSDTEQTNNSLVEKYYFKDDSSKYYKLGGLYAWDESKEYSLRAQGICPEGWKIPDHIEWRSLLNDIDPWYAWQYFGPSGLSGLNIHVGKSARREYNNIIWHDNSSSHWASDYYQLNFLREQAPYVFCYKDVWGELGVKYVDILYDGSDDIYVIASNYSTVRCVKEI